MKATIHPKPITHIQTRHTNGQWRCLGSKRPLTERPRLVSVAKAFDGLQLSWKLK
jgi:hypothetical protein